MLGNSSWGWDTIKYTWKLCYHNCLRPWEQPSCNVFYIYLLCYIFIFLCKATSDCFRETQTCTGSVVVTLFGFKARQSPYAHNVSKQFQQDFTFQRIKWTTTCPAPALNSVRQKVDLHTAFLTKRGDPLWVPCWKSQTKCTFLQMPAKRRREPSVLRNGWVSREGRGHYKKVHKQAGLRSCILTGRWKGLGAYWSKCCLSD